THPAPRTPTPSWPPTAIVFLRSCAPQAWTSTDHWIDPFFNSLSHGFHGGTRMGKQTAHGPRLVAAAAISSERDAPASGFSGSFTRWRVGLVSTEFTDLGP